MCYLIFLVPEFILFDLKVGGDGIVIQLLSIWTISIFSVFYLKRFGNWILPPFSGKKPTQAQSIDVHRWILTLSIGSNGVSFLPEDEGRIQSPKRCFK
jgi:hypothetical protein